jgi:hypothetical protein
VVQGELPQDRQAGLRVLAALGDRRLDLGDLQARAGGLGDGARQGTEAGVADDADPGRPARVEGGQLAGGDEQRPDHRPVPRQAMGAMRRHGVGEGRGSGREHGRVVDEPEEEARHQR